MFGSELVNYLELALNIFPENEKGLWGGAETQATWLGTDVLMMSSGATQTLQFLLRVYPQTRRSLHGRNSFSEAWQERAPWVAVHTCSPVSGGGGGPADRRSQRPASTLLPLGAEHPSLPTGSWGGASLESPVHTPHPVALVLTQAQTFQPSALDAALFFLFSSNGQCLLTSPVVSSGLLWGQEPCRARSATLKPAVSICIEISMFENKAFPIWGFINLAHTL